MTQERLAEALASTRPQDALALMRQASAALETELGAQHPQTQRARAQLARLLSTT